MASVSPWTTSALVRVPDMNTRPITLWLIGLLVVLILAAASEVFGG